MSRYLILAVVIVLVGLPLTLLSLREFQDDPTLPLDNLNRSVSGVLRKLPGVANVEVHRILRPKHRIVHLQDRYFVPRDRFAAEIRASTNQSVTDEEINRRYQNYIEEADAIQQEQMVLLRVLVKNHGLRKIHGEGFSEQDRPAYLAKIESLKKLEANQIARLKQQLQQVRDKLAEQATPEAREVETRILQMLADFRVQLLEMGAAGRLLINGEIEDVAPVEDVSAADLPNPAVPKQETQQQPANASDRQDAIVKNVLKAGNLSLIILGGPLDLTEAIHRLGNGKVEYLRVTTNRLKETAAN